MDYIKPEHIYNLRTLKRNADAPKHNDLFDRILLAQAKREGMGFITHNAQIPFYNEKCVIYV